MGFEGCGKSGGGASFGGWMFLGMILPLKLMFRLDSEDSEVLLKTIGESIGLDGKSI